MSDTRSLSSMISCPSRGLDDILHRHHTAGRAVFVDDQGDLLTAVEQELQQRGQRHAFGHAAQRARQRAQRRVALAAALGLQQLGAQHEGIGIVDVVAIHRNARERRRAPVGQRIGHAGVVAQRRHHRPRGHHVLGAQFGHAEQVAENRRLARQDVAARLADAGHRDEFLAVEHVRLAAAGDQPGQQFRQADQRIQHLDQQEHEGGRRRRELAPVLRAKDLGHDLRQEQDQQRGHRREHAHPGTAEGIGRLRAGTDRAGGMRDGVERKDARQRLVDAVVAQRAQRRRQPRPLGLQAGDERRGDAQQHRFGNRAQERETDRRRQVDQHQRDVDRISGAGHGRRCGERDGGQAQRHSKGCSPV